MEFSFKVRPVVNKSNHQMNVSIPKRKLKKLMIDSDKIKLVKIKMEILK